MSGHAWGRHRVATWALAAGAMTGMTGAATGCAAGPAPASTPRPVPPNAKQASGAPGTTPNAAPRAAPNATGDVRTAFRAAVDSVVGAAQWATAQWGVLVVDPGTGDTLYARNAGKLFLPASNQKIITGAVGLARLGADYRWRTAVGAVGRPGRDGTLDGDVYVVGSGDPTVSDAMQHGDAMAPLRALADSLWRRGVRRIRGDVVAVAARGGRAFPDGPWKFGWEWDDFDTPSGAGVTELLFNEGVASVSAYGGPAPRTAGRVVVRPTAGALPLQPGVLGAVRTLAAGDTGTRGITARWDYDANRYIIDAVVSAGDSVALTLGIHDPRRAYVGALKDALRARGIAVDDASGRSSRCVAHAPADPESPAPCGARLDTLAVLTSAPLRDVLPALEKPSQNQIAEALYLTVGRTGTGVGSGDSARRIVGDQLRAWGVEPERDAVVRDGSGLSRHDYVTPTALVRVLDAARRLPDFRVFDEALPIMGVDGSLAGRLRGTAAAGRVHAKTGSIDRARSLSGYATTVDGRTLVFSILCNAFTTPAAEVTRAQDAIVLRIAALQLTSAEAAAGSVAPR